jgi:single-stranded-DNA-specific exonuclease
MSDSRPKDTRLNAAPRALGQATSHAALRDALLRATTVVPHTDADGLAAGALALRARGEPAAAALLLGRGRTPWTECLPAGPVALLDWGMRALDHPAVIVDHHAPEAAPTEGQLLLSGFGERPETTTAALVRRLVPEQPAWLAAVGAVGDLGDGGLALPECAGAARTAVRKLVPLINAPRRGTSPDLVRIALALLVEHDDPKAALADPRVGELEEARAAWRRAWDGVRRTPPRVGERAALVRFSSPFQLHPLAAAMWARRLAPRPVLAANDGYLPGRVNFAVRGGEGDLRAWLRDTLPDVAGEFAHGHPRATGGSLAPADFDRLLAELGLA